nr:uncharacterized protein LOC116774635 [Danaus plexippus plexippus]
MITILNKLEVDSGKLCLRINRQKNKLMVVDRAFKLSNAQTVQGIEQVDSFFYLGSKICNDGSCVPEIQRRIGMGKGENLKKLVVVAVKEATSSKTFYQAMRATADQNKQRQIVRCVISHGHDPR